MKKRVFGLWTATVLVMAAAVFGVAAVKLWYSAADAGYRSRHEDFYSNGEYYAAAAFDTLNTFTGTDEEAYRQIVRGSSLENPTGYAEASAIILAWDPNESGAYSSYELLACSDDAMEPGEEPSEEYAFVSEKLEWYIENTFSPEFYPVYYELRQNNAQELMADWSYIQAPADGGKAMILVRAATFSTPATAWKACGGTLALLFLTVFAGAAVTVLTAKKFLQSA